MESLTNIWCSLISENENLTSIITFPFYFIETYLTLCTFKTFLKIDFSKKQDIIYVLSVSLVLILSSKFIGQPLSLIVNYGFVLILLLFYYKINFTKSILSILIPFAIFGLINTLILNPFLTIFKLPSTAVVNIPLYRFCYLCCVYIVIILLLILIKHKKIHFTIHTDLKEHTNRIILLNLILGIITLCMQAILTFYYINIVPILITLLNFILLFSYFFLSFYSLTKTMKLDITTRDLENAESYNKSLSVLYDNVKGFKHDFDNMVDVIGGYIKVDDMKGLKKYYSDLKKDCLRVKNIQILNPNIINNPGIYNLMISEYQKAIDLNIKISFEFFFDFEHIHMPIYEFSRILGILLNNAIEAANECTDKIVNVIFRDSPKNNVQIVTIENTFNDKNIDITKIFNKGISGKENHTGIGLWEVKQIEKKNNNIVLHTTKDSKYFKQQLEIYY